MHSRGGGHTHWTFYINENSNLVSKIHIKISCLPHDPYTNPSCLDSHPSNKNPTFKQQNQELRSSILFHLSGYLKHECISWQWSHHGTTNLRTCLCNESCQFMFLWEESFISISPMGDWKPLQKIKISTKQIFLHSFLEWNISNDVKRVQNVSHQAN